MSFPRYPEYKDSGVEWLGEVPGHWESWKISHAFGYIGSGTTPPSNEAAWYDEGEIPWVTTGELRENVITCTAKGVTREAVERFGSLRIYPPGSLVVAMYGATIGRLGVLGIHAATNQACCVLASPASLAVRFVFHWLSAFKERLVDLYAYGGGQPNISQEVVASLRIPAPSIEEQLSIAAFLDRETAKIDALVAEQQNLIALLKEKRQALISYAVTKGLDPDVPMKDSGSELLGKVPAHWEIGPLKRFAEVIDCKHHTVEFLDEGLPIVSIRELRDDRIDLSDAKRTSQAEWDFLREGRVPRGGDLIFCRNASVGAVGYVEAGQEFCMGQDVCLIRPETTNRFTHFQLSSSIVREQIEAFLVGATIRRANVAEIRGLVMTWPPAEEQTRISDYLIDETGQFDGLMQEAETTIALLQERRTALSSAAVTGKIDVRRLAAATSEPTPEPA